MATGRRLAAVALAAAAGGCVERRFVVETNVPGAEVTINNQSVGPSPADATWDYAGRYDIRAVAPGYEPARLVYPVRPKWYQYPPLDFFFEAVWPFHIEDVRRVRIDLQPSSPVRTDELVGNADRLRGRAQALPSPESPNDGPTAAPVPAGGPPPREAVPGPAGQGMSAPAAAGRTPPSPPGPDALRGPGTP
jgi:hypothetical protein